MNIPTHCLEIVVLLALLQPISVGNFFMVIVEKRASVLLPGNNAKELLYMSVGYWFVITLIEFIIPGLFYIHFVEYRYIIIALLISPIVIFMEFVIGRLIVFLNKKQYAGLTVHPFWRNIPIISYLLDLPAVIGEEIIFRQLWINFLVYFCGFPLPVSIVISAGVYAFNHMFFGWQAVAQKFVSGMIYGILYYFGGCCIFVPITTH